MIKRILIWVIGIFFIPIAVLFIGLNIFVYFNDTLPSAKEVGTALAFSLTTDWSRFFVDEKSLEVYRALLLLSVLLVLFMLIATWSHSKDRKWRLKNKYEKTSYSKFLTRWQRMRGTQRVKYNKDAEVAFTGIEHLWTCIKNPFCILQNNIAEWREWPATKRWNTNKITRMGDEIEGLQGGIPVIALRKYLLFGKYNQVWSLVGNIHNLFVGSTGRGKTETFVNMMCYSFIKAGESLVIHNPKRDIDAYMQTYLEEEHYNIIKIDFVDPDKSEGWNPLDLAVKYWKQALEEEKHANWDEANRIGYLVNKDTGEIISEKELFRHANLSNAIEVLLDICKVITFEEDSKNPFWHEGAGDMLAGTILLLLEEGVYDLVNFKSSNMIVSQGDQYLKEFIDKYRNIDDESVMKLNTYLTAEAQTKSSLKAVFTNKNSLVNATQNIASILGNSTFDIENIFTQKTAVFLNTHDEKTLYYPLVTMFFKQLYEVGIKESRKNEERRLKIPMNWVIDEFAQLPEIKDIQNIYGAARSRGVRIHAFIQSFEQLIDKYENEVARIIEDNSTNVIYLGSQTKDNRKRFSEIAGTQLVWSKSRKDYIERDLVTPERLGKYEKGRSLLTTIEWNPFEIKLPRWKKYIFAREPIWEEKSIKKKKVEFFNIQEELEKRKNSAVKRRNALNLTEIVNDGKRNTAEAIKNSSK